MNKYIWIGLVIFTGCGNSPTLQLNLAGTTAFNDANVIDIVFTFQNEIVNNQFLDQITMANPMHLYIPLAAEL